MKASEKIEGPIPDSVHQYAKLEAAYALYEVALLLAEQASSATDPVRRNTNLDAIELIGAKAKEWRKRAGLYD